MHTLDRHCPSPPGIAVRPAALSSFALADGPLLAANEALVEAIYTSAGHPEMIGRIKQLGSADSPFQPGDIVGVGPLAASCGVCKHCLSNLEHYCQRGPVTTSDYQTRHPNRVAHHGHAPEIVVTAPFLVRLPSHTDLAATVPLLGAGAAAHSALEHWHVSPGQHVGVIGLGGMGHLTVKLAAARGARVTVFTTTPEKQPDAARLGAHAAILWNDEAAFERLAGRFDLLISTVTHAYSVVDFMALLKLDGTLINLGTQAALQDFPGPDTPPSRRSIAVSVGASMAETHALIAYCTAHAIKPDVEVIRSDRYICHMNDPMRADARYCRVIDHTCIPQY